MKTKTELIDRPNFHSFVLLRPDSLGFQREAVSGR